jgi:hypothetical protein
VIPRLGTVLVALFRSGAYAYTALAVDRLYSLLNNHRIAWWIMWWYMSYATSSSTTTRRSFGSWSKASCLII